MPTHPHLSVQNLIKRYEAITVLNRISFDIHHGEIAAIIGPNGAGKSTLFNILGGALSANHGSVLVNSQNILGLGTKTVARMGISRTFQTSAVYSSLSTLENVLLAETGSQRVWQRLSRPLFANTHNNALSILTDVGLNHLAHDKSASLSYGDAKRLELALALVRKPSLLFMDEPTAGMAPSERKAFMDLVKRCSIENQMTVLFTEHDMATVFDFAQRVLVMDHGQLIADDTPQAIRQSETVQQIYLGGIKTQR